MPIYCDTVSPPEGYEFLDPYNPDIGLRPVQKSEEHTSKFEEQFSAVLIDIIVSALEELKQSIEGLQRELQTPMFDDDKRT